jgi:uncharacterized protein YkwD
LAILASALVAIVIAACGSQHPTERSGVNDIGQVARSAHGVLPAPPTGQGTTEPDNGVGVAGPASCATPAIDFTKDMVNVQRATLCLLNSERTARGLRPLRNNPRLAAAALSHSRDMISRRYFAHDTLGGGGFDRRIVRTGYLRGARAWSIGENIAWGTGPFALPAKIMDEWMHSPPHRANILDRKYREIGLGVAVGAPAPGGGLPGLTYTTDFGLKR